MSRPLPDPPGFFSRLEPPRRPSPSASLRKPASTQFPCSPTSLPATYANSRASAMCLHKPANDVPWILRAAGPKHRPLKEEARLPDPGQAERRLLELSAQRCSRGHLGKLRRWLLAFHKWCSHHNVPPSASMRAAFVASLHSTSGSKRALEALSALSATATMTSLPDLSDLRSALNKKNASVQKLRALPIAEAQMERVRSALGVPAMFVATSTSSRWDDIRALRRSNFMPDATMGPQRWVIVWSTTKANKEGVTRLDHTALLPPVLPKPLLHWLRTAHRDEPLTRLTTATVNRRLKKITPPEAHRGAEEALAGAPLRPWYSAHSMGDGGGPVFNRRFCVSPFAIVPQNKPKPLDDAPLLTPCGMYLQQLTMARRHTSGK